MTPPPLPRHKLSEKFGDEMCTLWRITEEGDRRPVEYAHRDDYYLFFFLERGEARFAIDFAEFELRGPAVGFILPEQVHLLLGQQRPNGWALVVDKMLVDDRYKELFRCASVAEGAHLSPVQADDLHHCLSMLGRRLDEGAQADREIIRNLAGTCIGVIAEVCSAARPHEHTGRFMTITAQFKKLLSANYKTLKKPSQYAAALHISPVYLNEAIKTTTSLSVSASIRSEIIVQAKRLLYYTDLSVKEIALELGYEDQTYFTRLFTRAASVSPTRFRAKYLE